MKSQKTAPALAQTQLVFRDALLRQIRKAIRGARSDGTVAMSIDNLRQIVRPPSSNLDGAPRGTNAAYYYAQLFRELCVADPSIASFVRGMARADSGAETGGL